MKRLGILGGMGPLCTASFYKKLVKFTDGHKDQDHIPTVIISDTLIPDRTDAILNANDEDILLERARKDIKDLESLNVSNIAIACNTMHYYIDMLESFTHINFINMVYETVKHCHDLGYQNICVLGTKATIECGLYDRYAKDFDIEIFKLDNYQKDFCMKTIYSIKETNNTYQTEFLNFVEELKNQNVDVVILACTELSLVDDILNYDFVIDSMDVLARESVKKMGYTLKNNF